MKKRLVFLLASLFVLAGVLFALVGCGGDKGSDKPIKVDTTKPVNVFIFDFSDTYIATVRDAMKKEFEKRNIKYVMHDAGSSQETQTAQIETALSSGTSLLVVNIHEPGSGQAIADKAKKANVPIIFFNREIDDDVIRSNKNSSFIGTDPNEAGVMQGELVAQELIKNWDSYDRNKDGKISYIMLRANLDNPEANGRTKYSVETANKLLKEAGKPELVQVGTNQNCEWATDKAKAATDTFITAGGLGNGKTGKEFEVVFANNDSMALGAISALQPHNFNKPNNNGTAAERVMVVGVDATSDALAAIQEKTMTGTIKQDAEAMAVAVVAFVQSCYDGNSNNMIKGTKYNYTKSLVDGKEVNKLRIPYAIINE